MHKFSQWMFGAVVLAASTGHLAAQTAGPPIADNQWYIGAQGGVMLFETPTQTRGAIPMVGGHVMVNLRRVAFLMQVQEGFGSNETSSFFDLHLATHLASITSEASNMRWSRFLKMAIGPKGVFHGFCAKATFLN